MPGGVAAGAQAKVRLMSFHEVQFPPDISYGATGGPTFETVVIETPDGFERRYSKWDDALCKWNVATGLKNSSQVSTLIDFFHAREGKTHGFRFKDWIDCQATAQRIGTGDDAATAFQLVKTYTSGEVTRKIKKPVPGTVNVYKDGVQQLSGWRVKTSTGVVTFTSPPADGAIITADFEFDVPCRFDTNELNVHSGDIPVVELLRRRRLWTPAITRGRTGKSHYAAERSAR
jgi:uncharacterized protein (TIGR02217 family)